MQKTIDAIRFLGMDMINEANSGHPGIVLGAAPVVCSLYQYHLNANPLVPDWFNRDRFILAAGHGSALLYATLHLAGYEIPMEEIKRFRQIGSLTPGHPEYRHTPGVDATTGPLGQGVAMAVGVALAESNLAARFNKPDYEVVNHYTYALCGDGDLQEGVTLEAMSLAGHWKLHKLIVLFDSNDIQLDGPTKNAVSDNIQEKVESMGFSYFKVDDANNVLEVSIAIESAKRSDKPSFIEIKSVIGFGSSKAGTSATHGAPLGKEEALKMKQDAGYLEAPFAVDPHAYSDFKNRFAARGQRVYDAWLFYMEGYAKMYPELAKQLQAIIDESVDIDFEQVIPQVAIGTTEATRNSIGTVLAKLSAVMPSMIGGSADLSGSTKVKGADGNYSFETPQGRNLNFGVREHAMAAITNGLCLHHMKAFSGGFFIFSDYMKPSMRLAALMKLPSMFLFTHDSVAVGEDGPTHEPIEQLAMFRSTPGIVTLRPAHANEVRHAIRYALEHSRRPSVVALTRQNTTVLSEVSYQQFCQGAYVVTSSVDDQGILIATGSEVELALQAAKLLEDLGKPVRVVSMPSMELFLEQEKSLQDEVLPPTLTNRLAIEMGATGLWYRFASKVKGIDTFGESAKEADVLQHFGFTPNEIVRLFLAD